MPYRVEVGPQAEAQLAELDAAIGASVERKIVWLAEHAPALIHRRLSGMPEELSGLCKLRVGDYRILYWIYPREKLIRLYRIRHRSEVYRDSIVICDPSIRPRPRLAAPRPQARRHLQRVHSPHSATPPKLGEHSPSA